mgnify:CR=1 FL=1
MAERKKPRCEWYGKGFENGYWIISAVFSLNITAIFVIFYENFAIVIQKELKVGGPPRKLLPPGALMALGGRAFFPLRVFRNGFFSRAGSIAHRTAW